MTKFTFARAVKGQEKLRLALDGPPGSGKTWTALTLGTYLARAEGGRVALIDSERSSALKYAAEFDFDHLTLPDNDPHTYIDAVQSAIGGGYAVIVVDSLSHAWEGTLDLKDRVTKRSTSKDSFGAWREVTPVHNSLVDVMLRAPAHVIATLRTKVEYSIDKDDKGKTVITKLGTKPQQREGVEYEFDVVGDMDTEHNLIVSKSRCSAVADAVVNHPGEAFARTLLDWLSSGEPLAGATAVAELVAALNGIVDDEARRAAKAAFVGRFGRPETLIASRLDDARAFVASVATGPQQPSSAPAAPIPSFDEVPAVGAPDGPTPSASPPEHAEEGEPTAASYLSEEEAEALLSPLAGVEDVGARSKLLTAFEEKFGPATSLLRSQLEDAARWLDTVVDVYVSAAPTPGNVIEEAAAGPVARSNGKHKMTSAQRGYLFRLLADHEITTDEGRHGYASATLRRPVASFTELSVADANTLIEDLQRNLPEDDAPAADEETGGMLDPPALALVPDAPGPNLFQRFSSLSQRHRTRAMNEARNAKLPPFADEAEATAEQRAEMDRILSAVEQDARRPRRPMP